MERDVGYFMLLLGQEGKENRFGGFLTSLPEDVRLGVECRICSEHGGNCSLWIALGAGDVLRKKFCRYFRGDL